MSFINYDEISYQEIVAFRSVAQSLNMSLAAKELNISQPAVSKRIASLERRSGLILFVRNGNQLRLTPAGRAFYKEIIVSMQHMQNAFHNAEQIQKRPIRTIHLIHDGFFDLPLLYELMQGYNSIYPNVQFQTHFELANDCSPLFSQAADLIIAPDIVFESVETLVHHIPICHFKFSILIADTHPLYQKETVNMYDLTEVPLVVARDQESSPYIRAIKKLFIPYGFEPRIEHIVPYDLLCFEMLSLHCVGIASPAIWSKKDRRTRDFFSDHIRVVPIENAFYPVSLIWRNQDQDELIDRFVSVFKERCALPENKKIIEQSYCCPAN